MKKTSSTKKLTLSSETVRVLSDGSLKKIVGGGGPNGHATVGTACNASRADC